MRLLTILGLIITVTPSILSFLQESNDLESFYNAEHENIENINSELQSVKTEYNLDGTAVIEKDIEQKQERIDEINSQLQEIEDSDSNCHGFLSCETCVPENECIWCNIDKTCYAGNEKGPYNGSCYSSHTYNCNTFCEDYHSYEQCINLSECGWCEETSLCSQITSYVCSTGQFFTNGTANGTSQRDQLLQEKNDLENDIYILTQSANYQNQYAQEVGEAYIEKTPQEEESSQIDWTQNMSADFEIDI